MVEQVNYLAEWKALDGLEKAFESSTLE